VYIKQEIHKFTKRQSKMLLLLFFTILFIVVIYYKSNHFSLLNIYLQSWMLTNIVFFIVRLWKYPDIYNNTNVFTMFLGFLILLLHFCVIRTTDDLYINKKMTIDKVGNTIEEIPESVYLFLSYSVFIVDIFVLAKYGPVFRVPDLFGVPYWLNSILKIIPSIKIGLFLYLIINYKKIDGILKKIIFVIPLISMAIFHVFMEGRREIFYLLLLIALYKLSKANKIKMNVKLVLKSITIIICTYFLFNAYQMMRDNMFDPGKLLEIQSLQSDNKISYMSNVFSILFAKRDDSKDTMENIQDRGPIFDYLFIVSNQLWNEKYNNLPLFDIISNNLSILVPSALLSSEKRRLFVCLRTQGIDEFQGFPEGD